MPSARPVRVSEAPPPGYGLTREWYAHCTDADWSNGGSSCNWYGPWRDSRSEAKADAARHLRTHT